METIILNANERTITGKKVKKIRNAGKIPAVLYGRDTKPVNLTLDKKEFDKVFKQAGSSTLVSLNVENAKPVKVLIHEPQIHPVSHTSIHADLYQVIMSEKIKTEIPLNFVGEAPAVQDLEGNLITNRDSLEVECLPDALVPSIDVDLSNLKTFDDVLHISDLNIPNGIEVLNELEEAIALVTPPREEEPEEEEVSAEEAEKAAVAELSETPEEEQTEEK